MGASRTTAAGLVGFLNAVHGRGLQAALRELNLEALAGGTAEEIFVALTDFVCPDSGTIDDGIARDAFVETIAELADVGVTDLSALTVEQMQTVLEMYLTHSIEARICNDIGTKLISLPSSPKAVERVEVELRDFIRRAVSDAMSDVRRPLTAVTSQDVNRFVDDVYTAAFDVLKRMGDSEDGQ